MNFPFRRALFLAGWAVLAGGAAWCCLETTDRQAVLASPLEVPADDDGNLPSRGGAPIAAGTRLTVPAGQALALSLVPGVTAQLEAGTDFSVDELTLRKTGVTVEERRARVTIHEGKGFFAVASPPDRQASLTVATPAGTAEPQIGTTFSVATGGAGARVVCAWGAVRWQVQGKGPPAVQVLLAGDFCNGTPPLAARKAADVPGVEEELAALLRFGPRANALQALRRGESSFSIIKRR